MSEPSSSPASSDDQEARTRRHLAYLDTLIALGMDLATRVHQQSTTPSDLCAALSAPGIAVPFITPEVIAAFAQINQTIRRAILVARKLAEPVPLFPKPARTRTTPQAEHPIQTGADPAETLLSQLAERLHSPDLEDRIGNRPIPEIIASICRDLEAAQSSTIPPSAPDKAPGQPPPTRPAETPRIEHPDDDANAVAMVLQRHDHAAKPEPRPPKR